ncbi:hypothetical protein THRCLA_22683 [Thraustotheca clavata]|uniref:Uncharacterized protein n=1 Tax=Thraustotheca clavata TaxID=74557 RepID=A0A1V9YUL3_9STRA|nr:hypothetical protein THRCLA_22683 [Thraustotheca clavata]
MTKRAGDTPSETSPSRRSRYENESTSSSSLAESIDSGRKMRALKVSGANGKFNELLVAMIPHATSNVVYFPGDVQNFEHRMRKGRFKSWTTYSYEATAFLLASKFPSATIWIIKPQNIQANGMSCYDHFLTNTLEVNPLSYSPHGNAHDHLRQLMTHAAEKIDNEAYLREDLPLHLLGFSRGVVVLNQLITELAQSTQLVSEEDSCCSPVLPWFQQINSIHWIDGGNGSGAGAFPNHSFALSVLSDLPNISLHIHWTPYQYESNIRPWIAQEYKQFAKTMDTLGMLPIVHQYFTESPGTLENHFNILSAFQVITVA